MLELISENDALYDALGDSDLIRWLIGGKDFDEVKKTPQDTDPS